MNMKNHADTDAQDDFRMDARVKKRVWPWSGLLLTYITMLFLVGGQMGIIYSPFFNRLGSVPKVAVIMAFWALVAAAFIAIVNWQVRRSYDTPMKMLSAAAKRVAEGDFSVYVKPVHTGNQADYLDVMFMDFNKMVAELGSIETLKNDFISNVSHEIKTPLAIICNYATILQNPDIQEQERRDCVESLVGASNRLNSLVTNILKLNKLESQKINRHDTDFDLCGQLSECTLGFETLWEQKHIEIDVDMEDRAMVHTDEETLKLVWNNLISNAIKFTPEGGKITLRQRSDAYSVIVEISDTGCGMGQETMKHIFDKFYQGDTSHSTEGNGLGLALASKIVDTCGGTMTVTSELGKGSTFKVVLPSMK
jgi:signal transduction histidine kinase